MSGYWSTVEGNAILAARLTGLPLWLALHSADPTPLADPSTEVVGGLYVRQAIVLGPSVADKTIALANNVVFDGMPATTVNWVSVWTDQHAGWMKFAVPLGFPVAVLAGWEFLGTAGDLVWTI